MPLNQAAVAAFDFDGTLTRGDTLLPFLARGLGWPRFAVALLLSLPWLAGFALRLIPNDVAKARLLRVSLRGRSLKELQGWTAQWLADGFDAELRDWTRARLDWHKGQGHVCVMVSASPDVYLQQVAARLGFDGLICTQMEVENGQLTGRMQSANCYGEQKVVRLKAWLADRFGAAGVEAVVLYAYGDTAGDKPMLRMADHAWYRSEPWDEKQSGKG